MPSIAELQNRPSRPLTGRHILLMLVAFFGVIIGVNAIFITKAVSSFTGEDVKGSYRQGLEYNKTLQSRAAQADLGWRIKTNLVKTNLSTSDDGEHTYILRITDVKGRPLDGLSVEALFKRPTDLAEDQSVSFTDRGNGTYEARIKLLRGQWTLKGMAIFGDVKFMFKDHVIVS